MKILSLYAGPPRGGCYERLTRLHVALARRGVIVHAVVSSAPTEEAEPGVITHRLGGGNGAVSFAGLLSAARRAARVARTERVDGLLAFGSVYAALMLPFRSDRKLITFLRGNWLEQERARGSGPIRRACVRWVELLDLRASSAVLAVSKGVAPRSVNPVLVPNDAPLTRLIDRAASPD